MLVGVQIGAATMENSMEVPQNIKYNHQTDSFPSMFVLFIAEVMLGLLGLHNLGEF